MPPRRSTRSASVQPAPPPDPKPPSSKRKRSQPTEIVEVVIEQENVKPPSRTRRSTSAAPAPATKRASSRKKSLEDVPEGDGDEEELEESPPVKKARPSLGTGDEREEEEEVPKAKSGRTSKAGATRKGSVKPDSAARVSSRRTSAKKADSDDEDYDDAKPAKPAARARTSRASSTAKAKAPSSATRSTGRSIRTLKTKQTEEMEHEEPDPNEVIEDSEDELLGSQRPPSRRVAVKVERPDPSQSSSKTPSSRRASSIRPSQELSSGSTSRSRTISDKDIQPSRHDDVQVEPEAPPSRQPVKARTPIPEDEEEDADGAGAVGQDSVMEEDRPIVEEERSLFDGIQHPPPTQSQAEDEPKGPQPRLTIHKMVLVNFKSYAGRQEIGPFHKVWFCAALIVSELKCGL